MGALQLPHSHVLVSTSHELVAVVRVELDSENRQEAQVAESERSVLLPLEYLDRERLVHSY